MQIEVDVVILCEWVEVRKVHLQQVLRLKGSERSHFAHNCLALTLQWVCQCWDMDFIHFDVEKSLSCKPYLTAGRADARLDRACPDLEDKDDFVSFSIHKAHCHPDKRPFATHCDVMR